MPTIDHIDCIKVSEQQALNELVSLESLAAGLSVLADSTRTLEQPIQSYEKVNRKKVNFTGIENFQRFGLPCSAEQLLTCYFHWFGVSVCNYVRLAGFLRGVSVGEFSRDESGNQDKQKQIKNYCDNYIKSIPELEPVRIWRDKVFAHFAITDPRKDDSATLLDVSTMSPISYTNHRFRVGGMAVMTRGGAVEMPSWSLTECFECLGPRFWPEK